MSEVESTQTLLLVDDEPVILELLRTIFQDTDYVLHCCADGEAALAVMETHEIDVLLTDKNLPGVGGLELVQHLKQLVTRLGSDSAHRICLSGHRASRNGIKCF